MNILVAVDKNIINQLEVMILSVKKYHEEELNIFIAHQNLSIKNQNRIKKFIMDNKIGTSTFINIEEEIDFPITLSHITKTTYLRLFAPYYLEDKIDRILYLDYDVICTNNIRQLYDSDFESKAIIGCEDYYESYYRQGYINAGVLLINVNRYKEFISKESIIEYIKQNADNLVYQDQTVLNELFNQEIKVVDSCFNYQINAEKIEWDYATIVHYITQEKPWLDSYSHPIKAIPYYIHLQSIGRIEEAKRLSIKHFENEWHNEYEMKNIERKETLDVIMPSYNATSTIEKTLDSIVNQVLEDIKLTVYLIDDASSEDYQPIYEKYKTKLNLKYYRMSKNSGVALARQRGIDEGDGDFFTIIDSDDYYFSPYALITLYDAMKKSNADVVRSVFLEEYNWDFDTYKLYRSDNIACHGKLYRKSFIIKNNIRYLDMRGNEDTAYNALLKACNAKYYDINVLTYFWSFNPESFTRKDKNYHEKDLTTFAQGFLWTTQEIIKRKDYIGDVANKIAELLGWIYLRINNCWYEETKETMYDYAARIYLIYRQFTGDNIAKKILRIYNLEDNGNIYFDFLNRLEQVMYNLEEYKSLSFVEKKKCSNLYLEEEKETKEITSLKELSNYGTIDSSAHIQFPIQLEGYEGQITINKDVVIKGNLTIEGESDIVIGEGSRIERNVTILTNGHVINPRLRNYTFTNSVIIGRNVYIGRNVLISAGISIGDNCYIGEGSVVLESVDSNSIVFGNPGVVDSKIDEYDDLFYNGDKKINWDDLQTSNK